MKREWINPVTIVQQFVANEYVAACGDSGKVYKFECNAGEPYKYTTWYPFIGETEEVDDHPYKVTTSSGSVLTYSYGPCGEYHEASENSEFLNGFIDNIHTSEDEKISVIIWTNNGTNVHCTTNLNMDSWETAKS